MSWCYKVHILLVSGAKLSFWGSWVLSLLHQGLLQSVQQGLPCKSTAKTVWARRHLEHTPFMYILLWAPLRFRRWDIYCCGAERCVHATKVWCHKGIMSYSKNWQQQVTVWLELSSFLSGTLHQEEQLSNESLTHFPTVCTNADISTRYKYKRLSVTKTAYAAC